MKSLYMLKVKVGKPHAFLTICPYETRSILSLVYNSTNRNPVMVVGFSDLHPVWLHPVLVILWAITLRRLLEVCTAQVN